jgi:Domain of unknown function (DUF5017)
MKNIFKKLVMLTTSFFIVSCNEPETELPTIVPLVFSEDFPEEEIDFNMDFDFPGWTNFNEAGSKKWIERDFDGSGYIQFSSFGSGNLSNIGWAITPAINLDNTENEVFSFQSASNFVSDASNKLEVLISTNFDGTNVLAATWTPLNATVANQTTNNYTYIPSGNISLSNYNGTIHIAFKVTGSGTNTNLDGLFQVDDVKVYSLN